MALQSALHNFNTFYKNTSVTNEQQIDIAIALIEEYLLEALKSR